MLHDVLQSNKKKSAHHGDVAIFCGGDFSLYQQLKIQNPN